MTGGQKLQIHLRNFTFNQRSRKRFSQTMLKLVENEAAGLEMWDSQKSYSALISHIKESGHSRDEPLSKLVPAASKICPMFSKAY